LYLVRVGPISDRHRAQEIANRLIKAGFAARVSTTGGTQYTITVTPTPQQAVGRSLAIIQSVQADVPVKIELSP
jgi:SPOR domain